MADNDLTNRLEDMFSDLAPQSEEIGDGSLTKGIVADLLEGDVATGPEAIATAVPEARHSTQMGAPILVDEPVSKWDAVQPRTAEASSRVRAGQEKAEIAPVRVPFSRAMPVAQRIKFLRAMAYVLVISCGLLLISQLIGSTRLTDVVRSEQRVLYLAVCVVALTGAVIQWKLNSRLADDLRAAEEKKATACNAQKQLEERVRELAADNTSLERRARESDRASQISRVLNSARDPQELLQESAKLVCELFDFYCVGLFLIDESGQWAILQAITLPCVPIGGEAGPTARFDHPMLSQGYRLEVGGPSVVGRCIANVRPLIISDSGDEAYHRNYTLLPGAQSEMTLPLQAGGRIIGALDLQSSVSQIFSQQHIGVFRTIADQLAVAIDREQTFAELKARLDIAQELERSHQRKRQPGFILGPVSSLYERTRTETAPLDKEDLLEIEHAMTKQELIVYGETSDGVDHAALVSPIVLRGEVIGALGFHEERGRQWTADEIALVRDVTTQVALAVENVSLFEQTQTALEETDALYRASRAIAAADHMEDIVFAIVGSLMLPRIDQCYLGIFSSPGGELSDDLTIMSAWSRVAEPLWPTGTLLSLNRDLMGERIRRDQPLILSDVSAEEGLDGAKRDELVTANIYSLAVIPLVAVGGWIGVLVVAVSRSGAITQGNLQPYLALAGQAALSIERSNLFKQTQQALIENRRLFEETRKAAEQETLLNEMLRNLATALDVPAIIRTVHEPLAQLVPFDFLQVALVNAETSTLEVFHPVGKQAEHSHVLPKGEIASLQETLTGQIIDSRKTKVFDLTDSRLIGVEIEPLRQAGIQTCIVIPLVYGHEVLGSLSLAHSSPDAYATVDVSLLERVAQLTAVAVENARLFDQLRQRAVQLQTAAEVSEAATSILNLDQLLAQTVELIRDRFSLYYVGLFIVDTANARAVLRAGSGDAGRIQLEQGHQLQIGGESMIGWCVANGQPRIALDVGEEAIHFDNPALPDTRSEMALPLISRGETIGALTVQSTLPAAFSREDVTTLQAMADQLANAIQNARFFEQTGKALAETEALYIASSELNTAQSYEDILTTLRQHTLIGQGAQNISLNTFNKPWTSDQKPEWIEVLARWTQLSADAVSPRYPLSAFSSAGQLLRPNEPTIIEDVVGDPRMDANARALYLERFGAKSTIFVPLMAGGQWIGFVNAIYQEAASFPETEVRRLIAICNQAAVAVQGLRQLQGIQARARREALIREITGKVRATTDLETILQTTIAEVSKALGTSHGAIRLGTEKPWEETGSQEALQPSPRAENVTAKPRESEPRAEAARGNGADAPQRRLEGESAAPPLMRKGDQP